MNKEYDFYNEIKNWDFSDINYSIENLTNWDMYKILNNNVNKDILVEEEIVRKTDNPYEIPEDF